MGEAELDRYHNQLIIHSTIITYGNASDENITEQMRDEIETMWNEPHATVTLGGFVYNVVFRISSSWQKKIAPEEVIETRNPRFNYFRIEEFAIGNISFVDGLGCNSGYFKLENLYKGSTTAAHEYGHTLGLNHPQYLDIRGKGRPGIMYPRGTWVDPPYQYDSNAVPGAPGGTMHPIHRKVLQEDIDQLKLQRLYFINRMAKIGEFSNVYHRDHSTLHNR
ncbi:MAG: peptidase M10 [Chitinophagaceae bacterium]|nr:peptidase M10 [Chitinophagaceae bacterium]